MSDIYGDGRYMAANPAWHSEDSPWKAGKVAALLTKHGVAPRTVAEIGCGAGQVLNNLSMLLPGIQSLHGYDISPQAIELCRSIQNPRLEFHNKDLFVEDKSDFDAVLAIDVLEHVEDYFSFLRSLRLKGRFKVFHIPLEVNALSAICGTPATSRRTYGHLHFFTRETALMALAETGYKVVDAVYTAGAIELPQVSIRQALGLLPRLALGAISKDAAQRLLGGWSLLVLAE
jgi:SAM-dependent methyltransferase